MNTIIKEIFKRCKEKLDNSYSESYSELELNFKGMKKAELRLDPKMNSLARFELIRRTKAEVFLKHESFSENQLWVLLSHELMHILHNYNNSVNEVMTFSSRLAKIATKDHFNLAHDMLINCQLRNLILKEIDFSVWKELKCTGNYMNIDENINKEINLYLEKNELNKVLMDVAPHFKNVLKLICV